MSRIPARSADWKSPLSPCEIHVRACASYIEITVAAEPHHARMSPAPGVEVSRTPISNAVIHSVSIEWGPMSAAAVLTILPTMVLFAFASRWIVAGLTQGATKG